MTTGPLSMFRRRRPTTDPGFPDFDLDDVGDVAPPADDPWEPTLFGGPSPPSIELGKEPSELSPPTLATNDEPFTVRLVRSARRTRTVGAHLQGVVLVVTVPATMSAAEAERWVERMRAKFLRKVSTESVDLDARAEALSRRYDLPRAREVRWAEMTTRWGSCTVGAASIRLSTRLAAYPTWVLDYVIVHELAHIEVPDHSPRFWKVVSRYPKAERARGYLIAKSGDEADTD